MDVREGLSHLMQSTDKEQCLIYVFDSLPFGETGIRGKYAKIDHRVNHAAINVMQSRVYRNDAAIVRPFTALLACC
jgi:hypothetical protein